MAKGAGGRRLATLDLGTNTVRLLVVELHDRGWRTLHEAQRVTRLGEGQAAAGKLVSRAMERTVRAVAELVAAATDLGAADVRIVATSAVREAANRDEFVGLVRAATGRSVRVVSGEDEARLTLEAVVASLPDLPRRFTLFDIGGGSTEFVVAEDGRPAAAVSLRLGVVALAERFTDAGPVDRERFAALRAEVAARLARDLPARVAERPPAVVGSAGTITTLAALDLDLPAYDPARVHGHVLQRAAVERVLARVGALPVAAREALPCVERGRGDLLIPGIAICLAAMDRLAHAALVVSDRGLREGILEAVLRDRDF
jgi:exopolyphosphatase/guanosine-5'-triphosphate,3'-diphosphate pyrophosphatase